MSSLDFGYPHTRTTFNSYLLRDPKDGKRDPKGGYDIYTPHVWQHFCFSFKKGGHSRVVLVGGSK
jgi:hypothetical protein